LFPVCIASLLFSYSANSRKCVIKLSVSVSVSVSTLLIQHQQQTFLFHILD